MESNNLKRNILAAFALIIVAGGAFFSISYYTKDNSPCFEVVTQGIITNVNEDADHNIVGGIAFDGQAQISPFLIASTSEKSKRDKIKNGVTLKICYVIE